MKHYIVLVMELCEYDLDHLVKVELFKEDEIVIFLHQLGESVCRVSTSPTSYSLTNKQTHMCTLILTRVSAPEVGI